MELTRKLLVQIHVLLEIDFSTFCSRIFFEDQSENICIGITQIPYMIWRKWIIASPNTPKNESKST